MALRFFYKNLKQDNSGYLFIACAQDYARFLHGSYEPLPALSAAGGVDFIDNYNATIRDCAALNKKNIFFSLTPLAARNTWQSSFYQGAESFARLSQLPEGDVNFYSPEWFLWACAHLDSHADAADVRRAQRELRALPLQRFFMAYQGWRYIWLRKVSRRKLPQGQRLIITSIWTAAACKGWTERGDDPFYGVLPRCFKDQGEKAALVYHAEGLLRDLDDSGPLPAFNFTALLRPVDWVDLVRRLLFFKVKLPVSIRLPKAALYRDVYQSLSNQLPLSMVSYKAVMNLARLNPQADFLTAYEGNCWERGVVQAAHDSGRRSIGYQHTSFAPGALKMQGGSERKVIASGPGSARLLVDVLGMPERDVVAGVSLRYQSAFKASPSLKNGKILVLLQGAPDDALFLHYIKKNLIANDVIVRAHPAWAAGKDIPFPLSENNLQEDLSSARVVLYTGTTAAFDALCAGVSAVHVNLGSPLSADPLFALTDSAVKKTGAAGDDLSVLIASMDSLSQSERDDGFKKAHQFIRSYFAPADQASLENIMNQVLHG